MQVLVHGGAGSPPSEPDDRQGVLETAADRASDQSRPLAAVRDAVATLEADPRFNAGVGGAVQSDGVVRTDAGVMTGDGRVGAAAAMEGVCHAVDVARAVATETPHVLLAGDRAVAFAEAMGVDTDVDLWTDRTRERWADADPPTATDDHLAWVRERFGGGVAGDVADGGDSGGSVTGGATDDGGDGRASDGGDGRGSAGADASPRDHDTVGAVARDGDAVAAATSTGGRWCALAGRVGDVPQVGAGFYASPAGGASATGAGEDIARAGLARRAVTLLEQGADAPAAARRAIAEFGDRADGTAGVVVLDADGRAGEAYDSPAMQTARRV